MFIFLINRYRYDGLILGNLNIKLNFLAILILSFKEIYTYDDGLVNLIENGDYSTSNKKSFFSRNKILNSSKIHYTIFDAKNTAKCQIERIFLLNKNHMVNKKKGKISIFLGQPLQELDPKFNRIYIGNLLDKLNVDIYFSHPREKKGEYELNYIDSELIVEDYIVDLIRRGFDLNVYGFYSTALLNIKSAFPELKVYYVYDREIFECPKILGVENILIQFNVEKF
jgi:beta-galactosamide-alpha-2,3-sialyltransferase